MPSTIGFNDKDIFIMMVWLRWVMLIGSLSTASVTTSYAGIPLWTLTPLTATTITITPNDTAMIQYQLTNQSRRSHRLVMMPIPGVNQVTTPGNCPNPVSLAFQQSCRLMLAVSPQASTNTIIGGPVVCQDGNMLQCYQPSQGARLAITIVNPPSLTLLPALLPPVTDNLPYRQTLQASGGVAPYSYAITAGSLPPNLVLDPTTGVLSGVLVTTATTEMIYTFTVTATDAQGNTVSATYQLQANPNSLSFIVPGKHTFTVPNGATTLHIMATGGGGGSAGSNSGGSGGSGGAGCTVSTTVAVTANQAFTVIVGGGGGGGGNSSSGSSGSGGGGGGSTNLMITNTLIPILIAGGGGGGSGNNMLSGGNGCPTMTGAGGNGGGTLPFSPGGGGGHDRQGGTSDSGNIGSDGDGGAGGKGGANGPITGGLAGSSVGNGRGGSGSNSGGSDGAGGGGYGGGGSGGTSGTAGGAGGSGVLEPTASNTTYATATNGGISDSVLNNGGDGSLIITFE